MGEKVTTKTYNADNFRKLRQYDWATTGEDPSDN